MCIEEELYRAAVNQAVGRYPTSWAGAAAIRTMSGTILTSIAPDTNNEALSLCMEVGAFLEAHRRNEAVTHSLCVARENEDSEFRILSPCGVCQERLAHWGGDVEAAITNPENRVIFKTIRELMPYHWSEAFGEKL